MSILVNKHRIMGLLAEIEGLSQSISGIDGIRRSGGVISGILEIDGDLSVSGDLLFANSNFYIDQENKRFGINTITPSGNLHIFNSSGDAGFELNGSGENGLLLLSNSRIDRLNDIPIDMAGEINHQDSGSFVFDRYFLDEGRIYFSEGFFGYNGYYEFSSFVNDRPSFSDGSTESLVYVSTGWALKDGATEKYNNSSTGYFPPQTGWYSDFGFTPTGTVSEVQSSKMRLMSDGEAALTLSRNSTFIEKDIGINNVILSDISVEVPNEGEERLIFAPISDFCGLIFNIVAKNYTEAKMVNFHVGWTDTSIYKRFGASDDISTNGELEGVTFRVAFNLPNIEVYVSNDSGHTVILGGTIKKLRK